MRLMRPVLGAAVVAALASSLSACGVSDQTIRPGAAAVVDGTTISLREVDDAAGPACDVLRTDPTRMGQGYTGYQLRSIVLSQLAVKVLADRIARENGIDATALYRQVEDATRSSLSGVSAAQRSAALPVFAAGTYANEVLDRAVTATLGSGADDQVRTAAGQQLLLNAQKSADIETNPLFAPLDFGSAPAAAPDLSVAVSGIAKATAAVSPGPDAIQALPADQRCTAK